MKSEKLRTLAYTTVCVFGVMLLAYVFFKYVFFLTLPFLIAFVIAYMMGRPAAALHRGTRISVRVWRLILTVLATLATLGALGVGIWRLSVELWELLSGEGGERLSEMLAEIGNLGGILGELGEGLGEAIYTLAMSFVEALGGFLSSFVGGIPRALLFLLITVISAVYFSLDLDRIIAFFRDFLPPRVTKTLVRIRDSFFKTLGKYVKSYLLLFLLTLATILLGLLILRAPYALLLAVIISLLDVLPVIGVGAVLLPWALWCFITGRVPLGVGLVVLYLVHTVIRQLAEPKILGTNLGVHPIITLIFLYVGYSLFGFFGLLLVPIFTVLFEVALGNDNSAKVDKPPVTEGDNS